MNVYSFLCTSLFRPKLYVCTVELHVLNISRHRLDGAVCILENIFLFNTRKTFSRGLVEKFGYSTRLLPQFPYGALPLSLTLSFCIYKLIKYSMSRTKVELDINHIETLVIVRKYLQSKSYKNPYSISRIFA